MGNVSGRSDGEGSFGIEEGYEPSMEIAQTGAQIYQEPSMVVLSHPLRPRGFEPQPSYILPPQVELGVRLQRTDNEVVAYSERETPVMLTWVHGGEKVAVTGSWDNWGTIEPMHRSGKEFILLKVLLSGVYHYRFIVDGHFRFAPDLPCDINDPDGAFNVLDVKEYTAEARESISDFEPPLSPDETYTNNFLTDADFSKPPPNLPPHILQTAALSDVESISRPHHGVLNHLYTKDWDGGQAVALGSTNRFLDKYVTVILYKPSWRQMP